LFPIFSILDRAPFKVATATVDEHCDKEHRVKIWNGSGEAHNSSPGEAHRPVGNIIGLARICPPTASQKTVAMSSLDECWVLESAPRELWERVAERVDALGLHLKPALL